MDRLVVVVLSMFFDMLGASIAFASGDPAQGAELFKKKCASCHALNEAAWPLAAPHLVGIVNAKAGQVDGFKYSKALQQVAVASLTWSTDQLDQFLKKTKMSFHGVKKAADRDHLIAYLAVAGKLNDAASAGVEFNVPEKLLALEGDLDYGKYLSSECMTCHQNNEQDAAIPNIMNKPPYELVIALYAYREGYRENQAMQLIAKRLTDEEIAALAYYFATIEN